MENIRATLVHFYSRVCFGAGNKNVMLQLKLFALCDNSSFFGKYFRFPPKRKRFAEALNSASLQRADGRKTLSHLLIGRTYRRKTKEKKATVVGKKCFLFFGRTQSSEMKLNPRGICSFLSGQRPFLNTTFALAFGIESARMWGAYP